jgi:hypothetical protein
LKYTNTFLFWENLRNNHDYKGTDHILDCPKDMTEHFSKYYYENEARIFNHVAPHILLEFLFIKIGINPRVASEITKKETDIIGNELVNWRTWTVNTKKIFELLINYLI